MRSRIQVFVFYKNPDIFSIVDSSEIIKERLKKVGIMTHLYFRRSKNPAFYSTEMPGREYIKKEVLKEVSFKPKIVDLYDK